MEHVPVLGFIPPIEGVDDSFFNTFRLGSTWARRLATGQEVFLMDEKGKFVFGRATVIGVFSGKLRDMCNEHGHWNHRELNLPDDGSAADDLFAYLQKLFGPHIAKPEKLTSVIYLKRIE